MSFKHKWQWDNRGKIAAEEGFSAYLESRRRRYLHKGEVEMVSDGSFETTARQAWKYEQRYLEGSGKIGFAAYAQAVGQRLASHNFSRPFQLAEDPRQQDMWTTWVEYLNYVYWWRDHHSAAMKSAEPQYRRAWDELQRFDAAPSPTTSATTVSLDEKLGATRAELQETRQQIRKFLRGTRAFRREETAFRRQEQRAQWVLDQLHLVETPPSLENEAAKNDPRASAGGGNRRKSRDGGANLTGQRPKSKRRRHEFDQGGSNQDPEPETGKATDTLMPDERVAASATAAAEPRRSKRRRMNDAATVALPPKPEVGEPRTRRSQRQTRAHKDSLGSAAASSSHMSGSRRRNNRAM